MKICVVITVEIDDGIRVAIGEMKSEDGMKQRHQKVIAVGDNYKLNTDSLGH